MNYQNFMPLYTQEAKENKVFNKIIKLFVERFDDLNEAIRTIEAYKTNYPDEFDYHLAASATIFLCSYDIEIMYQQCGYDTRNQDLWFRFRHDVRDVANYILNNRNELAKETWK